MREWPKLSKIVWAHLHVWFLQGILSVPGIAGYKWVPARIGRFYKFEIFFSFDQWPVKTGKTGTHLSADTSPVQCSLVSKVLLFVHLFSLWNKYFHQGTLNGTLSVLCFHSKAALQRAFYAVAFSKKLPWLAQTKVITLKMKTHAVNARWKQL